jgi:hypothetical protein
MRRVSFLVVRRGRASSRRAGSVRISISRVKEILKIVEEWDDVQQDDVTMPVIRSQATPADPEQPS